jgi:hypothetical protein
MGSAGIGTIPGLFSEFFNVAASRPAQMTTEQPEISPAGDLRQEKPWLTRRGRCACLRRYDRPRAEDQIKHGVVNLLLRTIA